MYNAIIAEDSKPILRNIRMLIESSGQPVKVTAVASNGLEALELLKTEQADILLTDIRMPKLDGLELIERGKRINPRLQAVLISGYSDFEYARRALNLQAFDYLLKPVEQSQLTDVLKRLLRQLQEQERSDRRMLEGVVAPEHLADLPLDAELLSGEKSLLLLRRRPFSPPPEAGGWTPSAVQAALAPACGAFGCRVLPAAHPEGLLALADARESAAHGSPEAWADAARGALERRGLHAAALACPQPVELRDLAGAYGRLERAMRERLTVSGSLEAFAGEPEDGAPRCGEAEKLAAQAQLADLLAQRQKEKFLLLLRQRLPLWLAGGARLAELERLLRFLADEFGTAASAPERGASEATPPGGHAEAAEAAKTEPEQASAAGEDSAGGFDAVLREWLAAGSTEDFAEALQSWCAAGFDGLQEPSRRGGEELFGQLDRYLRQNLSAQISVTDAGQQFHVSPSYISRIVKRYTGSTFVHYYMELKIGEARRLLASGPEVRVKDVADVLGFGDPHYFSKVFKEYAGCSPSEYKESSAG
ncbi:response regulator transcription factor [Saccharibacillus alkalitolerans]|uniref:Response regulator n=1 Tax=Saccharibacillus alkalitolerans TaxID=2705290 RepID=A0ABX0F7S0_9BACL|nr:response regulator [Saccharibacillus alkalitolerans]NGZ74067.1 response regulator [Saccharibacillus alkalitolerans]